jgi:hypothetical protein
VIGTLPVVLFVDDEPEQLHSFAEDINRRGAVHVHQPMDPSTLDDELLAQAHLVCMDLSLEHSKLMPSFPKLRTQFVRGLGLITLAQEHVQQEFPKRAIAFALYSGKVVLIGKGLEGGDHVTARVHNVDWVFHKNQSEDEIKQIESLAMAVQALPPDWPTSKDDLRRTLSRWLGLEHKADWLEQAWVDIEDCHPPVHGISTHTRGISFLRWMLHRILPYPTALVDIYQLAARLRVTPKSLKRAMCSDSEKLHALLDPVAYDGQLHEFMGLHWWRAGVNAVLFDLAEGGELEILQKKVLETSSVLQPVTPSQPVVVLGADLRSSEELVAIEDAVRVQPDGWPSFASPAWMSIKAIKDTPSLASLVIEDDREQLLERGVE